MRGHPYRICVCPVPMAKDLLSVWTQVTSFRKDAVSRQLSPWWMVGLQVERLMSERGARAVPPSCDLPGVESDPRGLIISVPFRCVFSSFPALALLFQKRAILEHEGLYGPWACNRAQAAAFWPPTEVPGCFWDAGCARASDGCPHLASVQVRVWIFFVPRSQSFSPASATLALVCSYATGQVGPLWALCKCEGVRAVVGPGPWGIRTTSSVLPA